MMVSKKDDWKVPKMAEPMAGKMVAVLVEKMAVPMVDSKGWDLVPMMARRLEKYSDSNLVLNLVSRTGPEWVPQMECH